MRTKRKENGMRLRIYLLAAMILVLAMGIGCSGQSSSSGGGFTGSTIVGTWNLFSSTEGKWPQQITFNANGTGSNSGGTTPSSTFTWTQQGSQIVITFPEGNTTMINNVIFLSGNSIILRITSVVTFRIRIRPLTTGHKCPGDQSLRGPDYRADWRVSHGTSKYFLDRNFSLHP